MGVYTPAMLRARQIRISSRSPKPRFVERRKAMRLAVMLPWAVLVAGCGQKGPLYHPPDPPRPDEEDDDDQTSAAPPSSGPRLG